MSRKIIQNLFSLGYQEAADYLIISSNEKRLKFDYFLDNGKRKNLSLPKRYEKNFFKQLLNILDLEKNELILKKQGFFKIGKNNLEFETNVIPSEDKEKIIIKFKKRKPLDIRLSQIGLERRDKKIISDYLKKKSGLIIWSGEEASGKSTSLLSCLREIDNEKRSIVFIGRSLNSSFKDIIFLEKTPRLLSYLNRYDADIIIIDEIKSDLELGEAFKLASRGKLVIISLPAKNKKDLADKINRAPWPEKEKIKSLNLIINQKLEKIPELTKIKNNRNLIARFEIIFKK